jgi:hypothetical protein
MTWVLSQANSMAHALNLTPKPSLCLMDDLPIETIASVNLASPIALSILWERGRSRERSLATVAPYLPITVHLEVTPKTGVMSGLATSRKLYVVAHLDSLLEGRYPRLECLLKGGMSGSNCCRAPWTC